MAIFPSQQEEQNLTQIMNGNSSDHWSFEEKYRTCTYEVNRANKQEHTAFYAEELIEVVQD